MVASASEKLLCLIIPTFTYLLFSKGESPYDIYLSPRACTWYHKMLQLSSYHMLISVFEALRQLTIVIVRYNLFYIVSMSYILMFDIPLWSSFVTRICVSWWSQSTAFPSSEVKGSFQQRKAQQWGAQKSRCLKGLLSLDLWILFV